MHEKTRAALNDILMQELQPRYLEVIDDSSAHSGHVEAKKNPTKGHFIINISDENLPQGRLAQHRAIFRVIQPLMHLVHACTISIRSE